MYISSDPIYALRRRSNPGPGSIFRSRSARWAPLRLITQAANWRALFTGDFGALSTLAVYIPWLALGLVIFGVYTYRDKQRGIDVDAILRTVPGVAESRASANGARS